MLTEFHWFWGLVIVWCVGCTAFVAWRWTEGKLSGAQFAYTLFGCAVMILMSVFATSPTLWP